MKPVSVLRTRLNDRSCSRPAASVLIYRYVTFPAHSCEMPVVLILMFIHPTFFTGMLPFFSAMFSEMSAFRKSPNLLYRYVPFFWPDLVIYPRSVETQTCIYLNKISRCLTLNDDNNPKQQNTINRFFKGTRDDYNGTGSLQGFFTL